MYLEASLRVTMRCQRRFELPMNPNVIGGNPAVRRVVKGSRSAGDEALEEQFATHLDTVQHIRQAAGMKRVAEDDVMVSPAKRAHTLPFPLTQSLLLSAAGRKTMLVPRDAVRISTRFTTPRFDGPSKHFLDSCSRTPVRDNASQSPLC